MLQLSKTALSKARRFIELHARPLDRALLEFQLSGHEPRAFTDVISSLATYQNTDGGFGHGLEPDLRALRDFMVKGFVLDDERLKRGKTYFGKDYFDELLERIREIRAEVAGERSIRSLPAPSSRAFSRAPRPRQPHEVRTRRDCAALACTSFWHFENENRDRQLT